MLPAADGLDLLSNGLLRTNAGGGCRDILLACGAITVRYAGALGPFDRLQDAVVGDLSASKHPRHAFSFMVEEWAEPGLGTADVIGALVKRCLIVFLRLHFQDQGMSSTLFRALRDPRHADAVAAVVDAPAAPHTGGSLAALCGVSRTAFAGRFSDTFGEGPIAFRAREATPRSPVAGDLARARESHRGERGLRQPQPPLPRVQGRLRRLPDGLPPPSHRSGPASRAT